MGKGALSSNYAGHEAFHGPFDEFRALIDAVTATPSKWDPNTFLAAVEKFTVPLAKHLTEEIDTLNSETLKKTLTIEDLDHCNKEVEKHIQKEYGVTTILPLFIVNQNNISGGWLLPVSLHLIQLTGFFPLTYYKIPWVARAAIAWFIVPSGSQWKYGTASGWGDLKPEFSWMACPPYTP
jgi:hypothetical protein